MKFRRTVLRARPLRATRHAAVALMIGAASGAHAAGAARTTSAPVAAASPGSAQAASAAQEDSRSLVELGIRHEHGEGVGRDLARAHDLYCAAARAGSMDAFLRLGWMYANGRGVERDDSIANTLFQRAATLGSELGGRLAGAIRGSGTRMPDCMSPRLAEAGTGGGRSADHGPTPSIDDPAEFRQARADQRALVPMVVKMAREFRLDPRLVFALIRAESGFDPQARSVKNAQGLMQLIPETAERFAVRNVWDPAENLRGGMSYLRWLLSYFKGDVVLTLAAYNAGEGAVDRYRGVPPFPETLAYVQRIRAFYPHDRHAFDPSVARQNPPTGPRTAAPGAGPRTAAPQAAAQAPAS